MFYFFSFLLSVALRDLHSFPTRRSSDLRGFIEMDLPDDSTYYIGEMPVSDYDSVASSFSDYSDAAVVYIGRRSEEHTSELQSRGHLVCRLLLEKKKTQSCNTKYWTNK